MTEHIVGFELEDVDDEVNNKDMLFVFYCNLGTQELVSKFS